MKWITKTALVLTTICIFAQQPSIGLACSTKLPVPLVEQLKNIKSKTAKSAADEELSALRGYLWQPSSTLRIAFLDGDQVVQTRVAQAAMKWTEYANIHFAFANISPKDSDIRISFNRNEGSWSYIGRDALAHRGAPTMNYGWLTLDSQPEEYDRVVLHEFGHALGMIHEHSSPKLDIKWNKEAVYDYYAQTNKWTRKDVDDQIFYKFPAISIDGTVGDPNSIMMYPVLKGFTLNDFEVGWNRKLSSLDTKKIAQLYPRRR